MKRGNVCTVICNAYEMFVGSDSLEKTGFTINLHKSGRYVVIKDEEEVTGKLNFSEMSGTLKHNETTFCFTFYSNGEVTNVCDITNLGKYIRIDLGSRVIENHPVLLVNNIKLVLTLPKHERVECFDFIISGTYDQVCNRFTLSSKSQKDLGGILRDWEEEFDWNYMLVPQIVAMLSHLFRCYYDNIPPCS